VEVDTVTGDVKLIKSVTYHDCGFPLNKSIVEGQVHDAPPWGKDRLFLKK